MNDRDQIEMMARCSEEIKTLRAQIANLQPRADAYDNMATLLRVAVPRQSQGYGEDLAWKLDRTIEDMKKALVEPEDGAVTEIKG